MPCRSPFIKWPGLYLSEMSTVGYDVMTAYSNWLIGIAAVLAEIPVFYVNN